MLCWIDQEPWSGEVSDFEIDIRGGADTHAYQIEIFSAASGRSILKLDWSA